MILGLLGLRLERLWPVDSHVPASRSSSTKKHKASLECIMTLIINYGEWHHRYLFVSSNNFKSVNLEKWMVQKGILSIWQVHVTLSVSCQNLYFFLRVKVMLSQAQFKTLTSSNEWIKNGGMKLVSSFLTDSFNNLWHWTTSSVLDCMLEHSIVHVEINYAAYYCIMTHIQTAIVCNSFIGNTKCCHQ